MVDFTKPIRIRGTTKVVRYLGKLERDYRPHLIADRRYDPRGDEDVFAYEEAMLENAPQKRWRNIYEHGRPELCPWHRSELAAWEAAKSAGRNTPSTDLIAIQQDNGDGTFTWFGREFYDSYLNKE